MKHPGSLDGITGGSAEDAAMPKDLVKVRARLVSVSPDRTQWKPYHTILEFDNVFVDIEVPAELVRKEKGATVLDVNGVAVLLDVYTTAIEKMNDRWAKSKSRPNQIYDPYNYNAH